MNQRNNARVRKCAICGAEERDEKFIHIHLTPRFLAYNDNILQSDCVLVCNNCSIAIDFDIKERDFINFLYEILLSSHRYDTVLIDPSFGHVKRFRPDLYMTKGDKKYIVECKSHIVYSRMQNKRIIEYIKDMSKAIEGSEMIFAFPSRIPSEAREKFSSNNIKVWDIDYIANKFYELIEKMPSSLYKSYMLAYRKQNNIKEKSLIDKLEECNPGRSDCYIYQNLIGEILEELFSPPLNKPISESSDGNKANRRDYILANYANDGFWKSLREQYAADYIVVDAKNYNKRVGKKDVLQIANYLKPYGVGMFAIIFSRKGGDSAGCYHTLREQWISQGKMIIILDDYDIKSMLESVSKTGAEDVIARKIEEFRLSM